MEMRFYLRIIRRGWWLILIAALIAVNLSLVYSYYLTRPTYEAVARFIVSPNLQNIESRDLVNSLEALDKRSIISTYAEVLNSREIINGTMNYLGADPTQFNGYDSFVTVLPDANIIRFSVRGPDPEVTAILANSIGQRAIDFIRDLYVIYNIEFLDQAVVPSEPIEPKPIQNAGLALLVGTVAGVGLATGEILIIADADILPSPDALRRLTENFADETVGCVLAETRMRASEEGTGESGGLYWRYEARIRQSESDIHSTVAATGHFMALRRKLIQPIPMHVILDDFYLAMMTIRQGYRVISEPKAVVWERPTRSMGDEVNRRTRLTAGRFQIISMSRDYLPHLPFLLQFEVISHKFLRLAIPHLMIGALLSNILFVLVSSGASPWSFWTLGMSAALVLQGIFYGLAMAGKVLFRRLSKRSKVIKVLMLPYYLCATNFAGLAGLANFVSGKRSVLWQQATRR